MTSLPYPEDEYEIPHAEAAEFLGMTPQNLYSRVSYGSISRVKVPAFDDGRPISYSFYHPTELRIYRDKRAKKPYETPLSQTDEDKVAYLYSIGYSIDKIRKSMHIGQTKIYQILAKNGIPVRSPLAL
jgi:hypothetical protein